MREYSNEKSLLDGGLGVSIFNRYDQVERITAYCKLDLLFAIDHRKLISKRVSIDRIFIRHALAKSIFAKISILHIGAIHSIERFRKAIVEKSIMLYARK